ncbi:MAG: diguanylate cyclase [Methylococcales bacterium]|nr:diguanylate cyclase [Methylococcales bacterium]
MTSKAKAFITLNKNSMFQDKKAADKWKEKYLDLLDQYDISEQKLLARDELLSKSLKRLIAVAKGLHPVIDDALHTVLQAINKGIKVDRLEAALEDLAKACMQHEIEHSSNLKADILFEYLAGYAEEPATLARLKSLEQRYQADAFADQKSLFKALDQAVPLMLSGSQPNPATATNGAVRNLEPGLIGKAVAIMLENLPIPLGLIQDCHSYRLRLSKSSSAQGLTELLDECAQFLQQVKVQIESEQQDLQNFLSQLTNQLSILSLDAQGASSSLAEQNERDLAWDQSFTERMRDLQTDSQQAQSLTDLKGLINDRLQTLAEELKTRRRDGTDDQDHLRQQLQNMSHKVKAMESETSELKMQLALAYNQALHDPLTGLANRGAYDERLNYEISRWQRDQAPLSLMICDIDHFKHINDTFGHRAGDKTLKIIASILKQHCRQTDFVARFGGEEFVMLLPNTEAESALTLAEKLRQQVELARFAAASKTIKITISFGISQFVQDDNAEQFFERADQALYRAKREGRNRCIIG